MFLSLHMEEGEQTFKNILHLLLLNTFSSQQVCSSQGCCESLLLALRGDGVSLVQYEHKYK